MNPYLDTILKNELKARGISDFRIENEIKEMSENTFILKKETNEILFVYEQKYFVKGGYYAGDIAVSLLSEPKKATYSYAMMNDNIIDLIFVADSNIEVKITSNVTVTSVFKYIKIIPIKKTEQ